MQQSFDEKIVRRINVLLSVQSALLGAITPHIRAVKLFWDMKSIKLFFFYDGEISEDDEEDSECAVTEVLANFPDDQVEGEHIRCDFPNRIPQIGNEFVFERKEIIP